MNALLIKKGGCRFKPAIILMAIGCLALLLTPKSLGSSNIDFTVKPVTVTGSDNIRWSIKHTSTFPLAWFYSPGKKYDGPFWIMGKGNYLEFIFHGQRDVSFSICGTKNNNFFTHCKVMCNFRPFKINDPINLSFVTYKIPYTKFSTGNNILIIQNCDDSHCNCWIRNVKTVLPTLTINFQQTKTPKEYKGFSYSSHSDSYWGNRICFHNRPCWAFYNVQQFFHKHTLSFHFYNKHRIHLEAAGRCGWGYIFEMRPRYKQ